ncbi:hypothetical protein [Peribacillus simplex]|uniref:hypothetical protein n=1 Tax=Peribacillus simplex TaxID=1478 RepID=UPI0015C3CAD1|nr:hypothetical protein [Peribacillus simplex]
MKPSAIDADRIAGAIAFPIEQLSDVAINVIIRPTVQVGYYKKMKLLEVVKWQSMKK